jgi:amino acid adenylation domain-containing protein
MGRINPSGALHALFTERIEAHLDDVAVADDQSSLTYRELINASSRIAGALQAAGASPGKLVGLALERSVYLVAAMLGVFRAGCGYVPLDPRYPADRLSFMQEDSGVSLTLVDQPVGLATALRTLGLDEALRCGRQPVEPPVSPADCAYVMYTSGSTGTPKGVRVSHGNLLSLFSATSSLLPASAADTWTLFHSASFDFSVWEIWDALLHHGRLVVVPTETAMSPDSFLALLSEHRVTILNQVPSVFKYLTEAYLRLGTPRLELRRIVFGGEALDLPSVARWCNAVRGPKPELINMYGVTEGTIHVTYKKLTTEDLAMERPFTPIGRPLPHADFVLVDDALAPVRQGEQGEILVGGSGVADGYVNRSLLNAERFLTPSFAPGRHYRTGDVAVQRIDGEFEFVGRLDDQIKIRGFRIEPAEVSSAIRLLPGVADAAVVPGKSALGETSITAYYTSRASSENRPISPRDLRASLARVLPSHMIPARFVRLESLPLSASGKTDLNVLRDRAARDHHA